MWQDVVIAICTLAFSYALIPQVLQGFRLKRCEISIQTSLITTIGLYILAICFFTLELYFSLVMNLTTGTLWAILLIQRLIYK